MIDWDKWITRGFKGFFASAVLFLAWVFVMAAKSSSVEAKCLSLGWTSGGLTWDWRAYCHARIDNSDVTVPLEKAQPR